MLMSWSSSTISSLCGATFSQVTAVITVFFVIGSVQVKMVEGVTQCVQCDSMQDIKGPRGTSCEKKPPLSTPCTTISSSSSAVYCIKLMDYESNGVVRRVARDCSVHQGEPGCRDSTAEQIAEGSPAKSCLWICDSDNCNFAIGIRYRYDVLIVGVLLTMMVAARV